MRLHYYDICDQYGSVCTSQWLTTEEAHYHELNGFTVRPHQERSKEPNDAATMNTAPQTTEFIRKSDLMDNFCGYDLNKARKHDNETLEQRDQSYNTLMIYEIAMEIDDAPTVDATEVVRCKNCKFSSYLPHLKRYSCRMIEGTTFLDDHFCSYGERKGIDND